MTCRNILFISKGSESPSTRYRALNYFDLLRDAGWNPEHIAAPRGTFDRVCLLNAVREADVVVTVRKTWTTGFRQLLRRAAKRLIFDFDDAVFVDDDGSDSATRLRRFAATVGMCDQVWAGNSYLAEAASQHNGNVTLLPTSINPDPYAVDVEKPVDVIDLVWIGGSATRKYLEAIVPALEKASGSVIVRLKIVADFDLPSTSLKTVPIQWSPSTETTELASSHIGIAPMADDAWTRGKCGLKVLQYLSAGLPVVASNVGVHREMLSDGESGFLVESVDDWIESLSRLSGDNELRQAMGRRGPGIVRRGYSISAVAEQMTASLERMIS